ncbi:uncharacterized protein MYCGRDRAFT_106127 [Zymoseptoria tritici IPO323]|uniref:Uncharacterized protein n=1 Tax=Zymoseptoria tritici (strain CBS 115943 / IPO323) TaxID=336722 RepID=F9XN29_ZYMTI|nr:uncharacterized protein MYCGRDRAFT_106127 [Zymoseptoria tritici IPO323]EGP83342.1 hypothetical protein MYCGRDRAFT_106127 [Zymoseptoria tritici IPO323]
MKLLTTTLFITLISTTLAIVSPPCLDYHSPRPNHLQDPPYPPGTCKESDEELGPNYPYGVCDVEIAGSRKQAPGQIEAPCGKVTQNPHDELLRLACC